MTNHKVLVSDPLGNAGLAILNSIDTIDVLVETDLDTAALKQQLNQVDAVIIRSGTKITADLLTENTRLKAIGRAGIGVDNVDLEAATAHGIIVMNTPHGNAITTAEHTIALMMAAARRIPQAYNKLKNGHWDRKSFIGTELSGKTLGIAGLGNIGSLVVERALGLKMNILGFDPFISEERAKQLGIELAELDDVITRADILTLHVPSNEKTHHLINQKRLKAMKPSAILINCARGGIVDENALDQALKDGEIAAAALDVFAQEPPAKDHPLLINEKVIYTPHLGASTVEAQTKVAVDVAQQIVDFLIKGEICNGVNAPSISGKLLSSLGPYLELGSKLGSLAAQLHDDTVEQICVRFGGENTIQDTSPIVSKAITAILAFGIEDPVNDINSRNIAKARGINIETTKSSQTSDYRSSIQITIKGKNTETCATGAIIGNNEPRVVRVNNFRLEPLIAQGPLIFATNRDQPGVIGRIGTILGDSDVNIAQMNVGRTNKEKLALTVIALDAMINEKILDDFKKLNEIIEVRQVLL
ncbi:D-3-phosphoglycerate dehydrogenase-like [Ylistrum balloti]|uniref:D-3-phosphoglycerate dehydrogenase-like n=1 Tax=Ylistrum balloti TaxID=509963 RepID=UPI00290592ED|nr:D-3-phosphoglycerate dehydrogenase-like [Ylistrum balloti]